MMLEIPSSWHHLRRLFISFPSCWGPINGTLFIGNRRVYYCCENSLIHIRAMRTEMKQLAVHQLIGYVGGYTLCAIALSHCSSQCSEWGGWLWIGHCMVIHSSTNMTAIVWIPSIKMFDRGHLLFSASGFLCLISIWIISDQYLSIYLETPLYLQLHIRLCMMYPILSLSKFFVI